MSKIKRALFAAVVLTTVSSVSAIPAYASDSPKLEGNSDKGQQTTETEVAKPACTADELAAFVAAIKAEQAARAAHEAEQKKSSGHHGDTPQKVQADGTPPAGGDGGSAADRAARREAEQKAEAAKKAAREKRHAADEKARIQKYIEHACAVQKAEAAKRAQKAADEKARARHFQAVGIVAETDTGVVVVVVKGGSRDLHKRRLAIRVTDTTVIKLDGETVALSGLVSGTFVSIHGVRTADTLVAARINAASAGVEDGGPVVEPSPSAPVTPAEPATAGTL
ncbi:MAG: hypothetical protein ABI912_10975 [Actinomycetota bacterium]